MGSPGEAVATLQVRDDGGLDREEMIYIYETWPDPTCILKVELVGVPMESVDGET